MSRSYTERKKIRRNLGRLAEVAPLPNLIDVQKSSYDFFLQRWVAAKDRVDTGLQEVFCSVFPIRDFSGRSQIEFVRYALEEPKYDVEECQQRGGTYAAPLRVTLRLVVWNVDEDTGARAIRDIKEQDVYMGDLPLMTESGTFIVNGAERVVVSQMHRSPGVFFDHDRGKTHSSGKLLFSARVIPYRGSWLDFEFDAKDLLQVRIDRRRKLPATTLLLALDSAESAARRAALAAKGEKIESSDVVGMTATEILESFYDVILCRLGRRGWQIPFKGERYKSTLSHDLVDAKTGEVLAAAGVKLTTRTIGKLEDAGVKNILLSNEELIGRFLAEDVIDESTGEVYIEAGDEITAENIELLTNHGIKIIPILHIDNENVGPWLRNTLAADKNVNREDALIDIYRVMRPGEPPTQETAEAMFKSLFFDSERYDLSAVGRVKMNSRLGFSLEDVPDTERVLRKEDILAIVRVLLELKDGRGEIDDIDHLGNRRVRSVGELVENQYRVGLLRMERAIRERMSTVDVDKVMPQDLINAKPAAAAIREFFGSSQLSQFMDQTNPLAEVTHKRRVSALGPGGLSRERAGFEVRDVHPTHYGRICPVETPEGPNIGLISSLATYARVNQYGFIETPYRQVSETRVTDDVVYMSAMDEGRHVIAEANAPIDADGRFVDEMVSCRAHGDYIMARSKDVDLIDVSPKQLVSVAAALIPFLENDDANRALMGSNMQRQAVPLLTSEAPLVGTGMESAVARDSGVAIVARRAGIVDHVDATRIVIHAAEIEMTENNPDAGVDIYKLVKFRRSNQNTCLTQRPLIKPGERVQAGDIIADGASTQFGELALGRNVLVAFMPWNGLNFEDSILISERIVKEDVFTSIHIEEYEVMARDTKMGQEEITRDIPNVSDEALRDLDEAGIVYIGAEVNPGDILVGKVTPKGESPMTSEEKLLRAIFGEKAADVRDTSLRVPPGDRGIVVDVRVFSRRGVDKDERTLAIEQAEIEQLAKDRDDEQAILERSFRARFLELALDRIVVAGPKGMGTGGPVTTALLERFSVGLWKRVAVADEAVNTALESLVRRYEAANTAVQARFDAKVKKVQDGDELLPGIMKMIKVFVAVKRKLQPGDKMAGRHGNKGVVSRIIPEEDMPFLEDGTPVDIVLNPLGVPSRMNVGQIMETHLGWACAGLGRQVRTALDSWRTSSDIAALRRTVKAVYDDEAIAADIDALDDAELVELSQNVSAGIPVASPVFDGARESDISDWLSRAGLSASGQVRLIDGRTGIAFEHPVTVGYIYMLKLHHLVDDKIHARSIGLYSLVTQQPLGGKAQFGGQRFGEMEVWALEAYGAAHTLQEMLTVKSDDVAGRTRIYESIVRNDDTFEVGIPESFNVLIKELRSLGLNVSLTRADT